MKEKELQSGFLDFFEEDEAPLPIVTSIYTKLEREI